MPAGAGEVSELTQDGLVAVAGRLGPSVALVAQEIFADRAVDGMRPVRALIRLADTYTTGRLEAGCRRTADLPSVSRRLSWRSRASSSGDRFSFLSHTPTGRST